MITAGFTRVRAQGGHAALNYAENMQSCTLNESIYKIAHGAPRLLSCACRRIRLQVLQQICLIHLFVNCQLSFAGKRGP